MSTAILSRAQTHQVYRTEDVCNAQQNLPEACRGHVGRVYQKMLDAGPERFVSAPTSEAALQPVLEDCPNFSDVIDDLGKFVALGMESVRPARLLPVLLAGDPGVGKTYFAKRMSEVLGVPYCFVSMGSLTASWVLGGAASQWTGARQGKVAETLIEGSFANPVIVLDELDKCGGDPRYDPFALLLQLLEPETASHFVDEFLDVKMDTSCITWVATANDARRIPEYILSRMSVYEVPAPDAVQARVIAKNIYANLLKANGWRMSPELDSDVLDCLSGIAPREMRNRLIDALGNAVRAQRRCLAVEDLIARKANRARRTGFLPS